MQPSSADSISAADVVVCENPAESGSAENSQSAPISYLLKPRPPLRQARSVPCLRRNRELDSVTLLGRSL